MTLQEQLNQVQQQMADEKSKGSEKDAALISSLEQQEADLLHEMMVEDQNKAQQERVQAQVEKVESIKLPFNFDEVFDDPRANLMIIELIKDLQLQAYAEHNAEVEHLIAEHKAEVSELKASNTDLKNQLTGLSDDFRAATELNSELTLHIKDALDKRDAAVRAKEGLETLLEEKQAQIDTLRAEIAVGAKAAINVTNISPSDKLAQLVQESKSAKAKSALDLALEGNNFRGKIVMDGTTATVAPLVAPEVMPFQLINPSSNTGSELDTSGVTAVPAINQEVTPSEEEVSTVSTGLAESTPQEVGKTLEEAFRRIEALEAKLGA